MIEHAVLEYVANSIWQVPMLAAMAWLLVRLGKPGARTEHHIWLMTLALCVLLPLLKRTEVAATPPPTQSRMFSAETKRPQILKPAGNLDTVSNHAFATASTQATPVSWLHVHTLRLNQSATNWLVGIYLAIVFSRLIQLAFGWRAARALVMHAADRPLSTSQRAALRQTCAKFRVPEPRMLISDRISSPMIIGGIRPALLLPETFVENADGEMAAIWSHELAHVRRRDYLANWMCQLAALPIAYHPATQGVQRRIRQTRELVCDAMAADAMRSATGYARCLVMLAQQMLNGERLAQQMQSAGLFDHDVLEERIMRLLEKKQSMSTRAKILRGTAAVALTASAITLAALFHVTPTVVNAAETTPQAGMPAANRAPTAAVAPEPKVAAQPEIPVNAAAPLGSKVSPPIAVSAPILVPLRVTTPVRAAIPVKVQAVARLQVATPAPIPVPPVSPAPIVKPVPGTSARPERNPHPIATPRHDQFDLTPEQRARMEQDMAAANARIQEATQRLQSPEFKQQMAEAQRQMAEAARKLQNAEVQRQLTFVQSPEFKQRMADMQRQVAAATKKLQSAEVQRQLNIVQSQEFKQRMAEMQQKMEEATRKFEKSETQRELPNSQQKLNVPREPSGQTAPDLP